MQRAFQGNMASQVRRYQAELSQRPDIERALHHGQLDLFEDADVPF